MMDVPPATGCPIPATGAAGPAALSLARAHRRRPRRPSGTRRGGGRGRGVLRHPRSRSARASGPTGRMVLHYAAPRGGGRRRRRLRDRLGAAGPHARALGTRRLSGRRRARRRSPPTCGRSCGRARGSSTAPTGRNTAPMSSAAGRRCAFPSIRCSPRRRSTPWRSTGMRPCPTGATARPISMLRPAARSTTSPISAQTSPAARASTGSMRTSRARRAAPPPDHRRRLRQALGVPAEGPRRLVVEPACRARRRRRARGADRLGAALEADLAARGGLPGRRQGLEPAERLSRSEVVRGDAAALLERQRRTPSSRRARSRRSSLIGTRPARPCRRREPALAPLWRPDGRSRAHLSLGLRRAALSRPSRTPPTCWSDGANWALGHWLTGRLGLPALDRLVAAILADYGVDDLDASGLAGIVPGLVVDRPMSARDVLEPLATLFAFEAHRPGGHARAFAMTAAGPADRHRAGRHRRGPATARSRRGCAAQETELPRSGHRRLRRSARPTTPRPSRPRGASPRRAGARRASTRRSRSIAAEAARRADIVLQDAWIARETASFALPRSLLAVEPGDLLRLDIDGARAPPPW